MAPAELSGSVTALLGTPIHADQLDAHEKPPEKIKNVYKTFHKLDRRSLETHPQLIDASSGNITPHPALLNSDIAILPDELQQIFEDFLSDTEFRDSHGSSQILPEFRVLRVTSIPGMFSLI